jgi:3-phenylpropionate/cinnamic acid dioxygenase small subunit
MEQSGYREPSHPTIGPVGTDIDPLVRQQLFDVVVRYATGIDARDYDLFRTCFTDDCHADYVGVGEWHGSDEITAFMERVHADCGHTMHWVGNFTVRAEGEGYVTRTYVRAVVLRGDNRKGLAHHGYYDDTFVPAAGGWRIAARRFTPTWSERVVTWPET